MKNKKIIFAEFVILILLFPIVIAQTRQQNSNDKVLDGELEVMHVDDFKNPENSKFIYYLRTSTKRYELQSDRQFPSVTSGTPVRVKGDIEGNTITVQAIKLLNSPDDELSRDNSFFSQPVPLANKPGRKLFSLSWIYFASPLVLVGILIGSHEMRRKRHRAELFAERNVHRVTTLRNWAYSNLKKGYSKEQMKSALIKNNYNPNEIEESFRGIK